MTNSLDREAVAEPHNLLGIDGIEFIEFATSKPQALGGVLERMGSGRSPAIAPARSSSIARAR
jgi:4-hydroxyphenylpyruvate dioxygenase-like putative hemolysin